MNGVQKDLLRYRAERLLKFIDLNAPLVYVAAEIMLIFRSGFVTCGDAMVKAFGEYMQSKTRYDAGLCQKCNSTVRATLPSICELCDAKEDTEMQEWGVKDDD